jgi:hypothetical protein
MLLARLGHPMTREGVLRLFELPQHGAGGVDLERVATALERIAQVRDARWAFRGRLKFAWVVSLVRRQIEATGYPTLIWFGAVHAKSRAKARHVAVAISATPEEIQLLDPLGLPPRRGLQGNVAIRNVLRRDRLLPAVGTFYHVNPWMMVGVLRWR